MHRNGLADLGSGRIRPARRHAVEAAAAQRVLAEHLERVRNEDFHGAYLLLHAEEARRARIDGQGL